MIERPRILVRSSVQSHGATAIHGAKGAMPAPDGVIPSGRGEVLVRKTVEQKRPNIPITDAVRAERFVGDPVSVEGKAVNTDCGAAIELPDVIIHCAELPAWPLDVEGRSVTATGELADTGEEGAPFYVLREPRYEAEPSDALDEFEDEDTPVD